MKPLLKPNILRSWPTRVRRQDTESMRGRETDPGALQRMSNDRLRQAKMRFYCSVCKRRGHCFFDLQARATSEIAVADLSDSENR